MRGREVWNGLCGVVSFVLIFSFWDGDFMVLRKWDDLPEFMRTEEVKPYYEVLNNRRGSLVLKRMVDLIGGVVLLVLLAIPMAIISVLIKLDSEGPVFYRQERVTTYGLSLIHI